MIAMTLTHTAQPSVCVLSVCVISVCVLCVCVLCGKGYVARAIIRNTSLFSDEGGHCHF